MLKMKSARENTTAVHMGMKPQEVVILSKSCYTYGPRKLQLQQIMILIKI